MKDIIKALREALARQEHAVLCTIVASEGSSPRSAGAKMAVFADGTIAGTIGGGAVEYSAITLARELLGTSAGVVRRYMLHPVEQDHLNMICGGEVTVFFAPLRADDAAMVAALESWGEWEEKGKTYYLFFSAEASVVFRPLEPAQLLHERPGWDGTNYLEKIESAKRVLLFGGGHVGRALVPVLQSVGFRVWVIDEREEIARREYFPKAERVLCSPFADIPKAAELCAEDYVVVMTAGHEADYTVLRQVLARDAAYIGCIGSRRKAATVREKLAAAGFTAAQIAGIHSPIGLAIGAQTPEEIAISITAEMIAHRASAVKE